MKIEDLLSRVNSLFAQTKVAFPMLPPMLLQCACVARPGLSVIRQMQEFTEKLSNAGIPIGPNPDGSPCMSLSFGFSAISAINNDIVKNSQVQIAVPTPAGILTLFGITI